MKRKVFLGFLGCEALFCVLLVFTHQMLPNVFTAAMAFPFEQIGKGLRMLSLSGNTGNVLAIILYSAICLLPLVALQFIRKKRKLTHEDSFLAILSVVLFAVLYLMINPGLMGTYLGEAAGQSIGKAILGSITYSIILGYAILRILRLSFAADTGKLQKYLAILLCVLNILFVYIAFGTCFGDLMDSIEALRTTNTGNEHILGISYVFLALRYIVNALPYVLDILVAFTAFALLKELTADRYSDAAVITAGQLSRICGLALKIIVTANVGFNLMQLALMKMLLVVNTSVQIPLMSIVFVLAALLLAQYIKENKMLKDDNDMFI